jgi:dihydrofolate synthase / folylpolyglutamate synthase
LPLPPDAARALDALGRFGIHLGLDHVRRLAAALGEPQLAVPTVLVAGTNGKGSTAALLAAMAQEAGLATGLYTSPHLEDVTERLRLDGRPVDGEVLGAAVLEAVAAARRVLDGPPTCFEALTAAAWLVLRGTAVDLAVVEVGLGGRLDATNAAEPVLSVVTPVSLEHREVLGDTLAAVAREKAGVLRGGRPAVAWGAEPEVRRTLAETAAEIGADLSFADDEVAIVGIEPRPPAPWGGLRVVLETPLRRYELETPLAGRHQAVNLALAVRAAERLAEVGRRERSTTRRQIGEGTESGAGFPEPGAARGTPGGEAKAGRGPAGGSGPGRELLIGEAAMRRGAAAVRWPGRLEVVELPAGAGTAARRVVLDAAHNPAGAEALAAFLDEAAAAGSPPPVLLFGVLGDKEVGAMLPPLAGRARSVVLTRPPGDRGRDPRQLLALLPPGTGAETEPDPERAAARALESAARTAAPVVVCGSIFLVGAVRAWMRGTFGIPVEPDSPLR